MVTLENLRQLDTPDGRTVLAAIDSAAPTSATAIALGARLRKTWPSDLVAAAMEQHELRQLARTKFDRPEPLWFTREGLEQATAAPIARWRSERFDGYRHIVDACCGIGGDLIALATNDRRDLIVAIDRDPLHLEIARLNLEAIGITDKVTLIEGDVRDAEIADDAAVFIDPARRSGKGRMALGDSEPPLEWCIDIAANGQAVGIKFAPGIDHNRIPEGWELETIALGFDLKEAVLWSPALARTSRSATVIIGNSMHTISARTGEPPRIRTPEPGDYLLDPNPAVTRAGLVQDLARMIGAEMIDDQIAFLVAARAVESPFVRSYRVIASLPWNEKHLKRTLVDLGAGAVDIRRRGLPGDVDAITKRLRGKGDRAVTIAMTRASNIPWAIVCERK